VEVGVNIGRQIHLHCSSAGKAILAHYPRQRVDEIIDRWELPPHTENTITDRAELYNELDRVRERGYAFNREEHVEGVHAIAAPIRHNQETIGVISVSGPANRLQGKRLEEELPSLLLSTINEIELNIAYQRADHTGTHIVE
jgi:DNA-binding IclR family transcriptional regulator